MRALTPWTGIDVFKREMDRLFDRFFEPRWDELELVGEWTPKIDIAETKDAVVVKAAAVEGAKVSATFKHGVLTVTLPKAPTAKGTTIPVKAE